MELNDIIYLSLLIFTIVFSYFFRQLNGINIKKWTSTTVGFLIVLFVSGFHIIHTIVCVLINAGIIFYISKRSCHIYSFVFSFLYLIFFRTTVYFGINYPPAHTNLIQMILVLKMVGLAFEFHDSYIANYTAEKNQNGKKIVQNISLVEIFHYAYCHIGVLTGPYYSYKTFSDYYKCEFYKNVDCDTAAMKKLIFVPLYATIFLFSTHYFPIKYAESDVFYSETTFWYRLWYITPTFISFRMRIYIGLLMSEATCIIAGLGAYPSLMEPKPGKGPSKTPEVIEEVQKNTTLKSQNDCDFNTVLNISIWHTETDPWVRSSIHYWNMCVQYWMANVVYKRFPIKTLRTAVTFGVSALWHGVHAGYYLCLCSVPPYLFIEDIWKKILNHSFSGLTSKLSYIILWTVRTQAFSYMGMAFSLLSMKNGLRYYGSVYYVYHVTSFIALILGLIIKKKIKNK